jgi:type I restriction enzyme S subunit
MSEWINTKLNELVEVGSSKRIFYNEYVKEGIPFYRSKEIIEKHNRRNVSSELYISNERYELIKEKFGVPKAGDILLTSVGTIGIPYIVENDGFYFKDGNLTWFRNFNKSLNNKFLYYYLISPLGIAKLDNISIGSTQKALTINGLKEIEINLPPLPEQKAIASVLSCLDDKIDLLHRQNEILEKMAETLFRKWFVEDAKEDWKTNNLSFFADFFNGKARPNEEGKIPIYGGNGILGYANKSNYSGKSIIIGRVGAYCGSLYYENNEIWVSDNALLVKSKQHKTTHFLFYLLKTLDLNSMAEGSSHPLLTQTLLKSIEIQIPPNQKIDEFDVVVENIQNKIESNQNQIRTLTVLRDTLLPKLMSGEVRVKLD